MIALINEMRLMAHAFRCEADLLAHDGDEREAARLALGAEIYETILAALERRD